MEVVQDYLLDNGYLPHFVIRRGIRRLLAQRLSLIASTSLTASYDRKAHYINLLRTQPIAINTADANQQHYEVGTDVLRGMLGPRMKYSCCLYPTGYEDLAMSEVLMMNLYTERAGLEDGMEVLDLGCGWGSMTLFLAEKFANMKVTGFSNSKTQREWIESEARRKELTNVRVITGDVVEYEFEKGRYDRVVSVELFEHMKNYQLLMGKVARALKPGGMAFVHLFCHKDTPYDFDGGWMSDHFFTGGTMPSADLLLFFQDDLRIKSQWWVNGKHYSQTCEQWLTTMLKNKSSVWKGLEETYGADQALRWWNRWQVFYLACSELFNYGDGEEWGVGHYLFEKPA